MKLILTLIVAVTLAGCYKERQTASEVPASSLAGSAHMMGSIGGTDVYMLVLPGADDVKTLCVLTNRGGISNGATALQCDFKNKEPK